MTLRDKILSENLPDDRVALFYTGQVGFIFKFRGKYILIDGYLSDIIDRNNNFAPGWVRRYPSPITGAELDFIDYVFCTHDHTDHADPVTLGEIARVNSKARFFCSEAIKSEVSAYLCGRSAVGVAADKAIDLGCGIAVTPIPAAHEVLHKDKDGNYKELGFIFDFGGKKVCHTGDCCMYDGLTERVRDSDILMTPVNGRDYFRNREDIIGCFDSYEAVHLAKAAGAKMLVPMHFDMYEANSLNPAQFVDTLYRLNPSQSFHIFTPGEKYIY